MEYPAAAFLSGIGVKEMKIYGKNPVLERLKANPRSIRVIFVETGHPEHSYIASKAKKYGLPISVVPPSKMLKLGRSLNTQGLMLEVEDFAYTDYDEVLETAEAKGITLVFADGITDPQNMGAIMRTLGCLGGFVLVMPSHDSVHVTEAVLRVACGADNYLSVCKVSNLSNAIQKARSMGFSIVGSVTCGGEDMRRVKLQFPLGLVIGSEDKGIRDVVQQQLDVKVTVPMAHPRLSLNAAHAAAMLAFEASRQRPASKKHPAPRAEERTGYDDLPE